MRAGPWRLVEPIGEWGDEGQFWVRDHGVSWVGKVFWDWYWLLPEAESKDVYGPFRPTDGKVHASLKNIDNDYLGEDDGEGGPGVADAKRAVDIALAAAGWELE